MVVGLLFCIDAAVAAQTLTITGTVKDNNGETLPGVNIRIQGTSTGVVSTVDGTYSILVSDAQSVLEFSFVGYSTVTAAVGDRRVIDVTLQEGQELEEVVVVGYGTLRKKDLTGSVATVSGEDIIAQPVANVAEALQGKIAGVTITTQDGRPDAAMRIRVRGGGSITQSNEPLYIVDGFPVSNLNDIPSSQIENITILKDASSTAIYGARGANGVVLVTTKGATKDRINVTYDTYFQVKTLADKVDVMSGSEYVKFNWELYELHSGKSEATYRQAFAIGAPGTDAFRDGIRQYDNVKNTDWQEEIYGGPTWTQSHNVTVSGGNEKTRFLVGYNALKDDALRVESWYKRQNLNARLNAEIAKGLVLDIDFRFTDGGTFGSNSSTNSAIYYAPVPPLGEYDSNVNPGFVMESDNVNPAYNPKAMIEGTHNERTRKGIRINGAVSWEIIKGLTFKTEYGKNYNWQKNYEYSSALVNHTEGLPSAEIDRNEMSSTRLVNTLTWDVQKLGNNHRLNILAGQEANETLQERSSMEADYLPATYDTEKAFGAIDQWDRSKNIPGGIISNAYDTPIRMLSWFGRVNYTFKDRYIFTATLRADGSSRFAPGNRWGYFPAAAVAWRVSDEAFLSDARWIDNLKLRLSFGAAGNDRIDADLWRFQWKAGTGGYAFNNVRQGYYQANSTKLINPDLKWETTITRNIGLDFNLFRNRVYGTFEGYWNTTKDLLIESDIPTHLGYTTQQQNIGQTRNRGVEVTLGGDIVRSKDFVLSASFNIGFNKNKIEKLATGMPFKEFASAWGSTVITPYNDYRFEVGKSAGLIMGYITDGFYSVDDFDYNTGTGAYTLKPGQYNSVVRYQLPVGVSGNAGAAYPGALKFKKISDDDPTNITTADITEIGDTNPVHTGGFNLNVIYKGFDATASFSWSYGNDIYNANKLDAASMTQNKVNVNLMGEMVNRFRLFDEKGNRVTDPDALKELNKNATIWYPYQNTRVVHSWGIEDGSFLRLNNVTIGYTLPKDLTQKVYVSKLRVYATAYNLFTWTKYSGINPEVNSNSDNLLTPGLDWNAYPRARSFTFGLNLVF
jgi:TonB-linked SusC/RagA family outer membrane protein